jgi:hypothetical protein
MARGARDGACKEGGWCSVVYGNSISMFGCKYSFDWDVVFGSVSERRLVKIYSVCAEIVHHIMWNIDAMVS